MNDINLSKRLNEAFLAVREGSVCADVGCDHGKLSAKLVLSGKASFVYAVDINEKPLSVARALFDNLKIQNKTKPVLANGVASLEDCDIDDVIIAGIGSDITIGIIDSASWLKNPQIQLVLVPSSRHSSLRTYLFENGFELIKEKPVFEDGHCYTVITTRYTGAKTSATHIDRQLGLILNDNTTDGIKYKQHVLKKAEIMLENIKLAKTEVSTEKQQQAQQLYNYLSNALKE